MFCNEQQFYIYISIPWLYPDRKNFAGGRELYQDKVIQHLAKQVLNIQQCLTIHYIPHTR